MSFESYEKAWRWKTSLFVDQVAPEYTISRKHGSSNFAHRNNFDGFLAVVAASLLAGAIQFSATWPSPNPSAAGKKRSREYVK